MNERENGKHLTEKEFQSHERQQREKQEQVRREVSALVRRVAEGYKALENLMEQNPWLAGEMDAQDRERKRPFDDKVRKGLSRADDAPRCRWVKQDGTSCGSPQLRKHIYCYAHRQMMEARALALRLPAAEDANAIQVALMRVQKALIDDHISVKKAGVLFYSLQLAITNVGQTTFGQANDDDLVMETVEEQDAMREEMGVEAPKPIFTRDMPGLREYQRPFTAEGAEDTKKSKSLPLMNADDTDLGNNDRRIGPKSERDAFWGEFPGAVRKIEAESGSFDAPSLAPHAPACSA